MIFPSNSKLGQLFSRSRRRIREQRAKGGVKGKRTGRCYRREGSRETGRHCSSRPASVVTAATPSVIRTGRRDKADVSRFSRSASITKSFFSMGLDLYSGTSRLFYDRRVRFREKKASPLARLRRSWKEGSLASFEFTLHRIIFHNESSLIN